MTEQVGFTTSGKTIDHDNPLCLAKQYGETYYIKQQTVGPLGGYLVNPFRMLVFNEVEMKVFHKPSGKPKYNYVKVDKEVFDYYIKFLTTRNIGWLHNAERARI